MKSKRSFISIYFDDGLINNRKKRDITIGFDSNDPLYIKCKELGSSGIKKVIGVDSYSELLKEASKEDRSLNNFIKHRLKEKLCNE